LDTPPNLTASSDINNPNNPLVMKKRLKEELQKTSLEGYMQKVNPSRTLLRKSLKLLGIVTGSKDRDELIGLLKYQVSTLGLEYILQQLPMKLLQQMATEASLSINTTSKNLMVRHLVDMRDYRANQNRKPKSNADSPGTQKNNTDNSEVRIPTSQSSAPKKTNRKPKPEEIDLIFDSDDSEDFNPNLHKMEDISIPSQDDADKDATSEDEEEDVDDDDYREHKKKKSRSSHREPKRKKVQTKSDEESDKRKAAKGKNPPSSKEDWSRVARKKSHPESSEDS